MEEGNVTTLAPAGDESCPYFPSEPWKCDTIMIFHRVVAVISLIGCGFLMLTIWLFRRYTVTNQRMILCIGICGAGGAVANIAGEHPDPGFCKIIAFVNTFFDWAMLLWVCAVATRLCLAIFKKSITGRYEWAYHYIIWSVSLVISLLPFFANKYGNSGVWCWIVNDIGWRMGMWYGPMLFVTVALFVLYITIIIKIRSMLGTWQRTFLPEVEENKKFLRSEVLPLAFYPFVYLLLYILPTANRIHNALYPDEPVFTLVVLAAISATSLGAANALIYGLDKRTRRKLRWQQIKSAWSSHFTSTVIGEYKTERKPGETKTAEKSDSKTPVPVGGGRGVSCYLATPDNLTPTPQRSDRSRPNQTSSDPSYSTQTDNLTPTPQRSDRSRPNQTSSDPSYSTQTDNLTPTPQRSDRSRLNQTSSDPSYSTQTDNLTPTPQRSDRSRPNQTSSDPSYSTQTDNLTPTPQRSDRSRLNQTSSDPSYSTQTDNLTPTPQRSDRSRPNQTSSDPSYSTQTDNLTPTPQRSDRSRPNQTSSDPSYSTQTDNLTPTPQRSDRSRLNQTSSDPSYSTQTDNLTPTPQRSDRSRPNQTTSDPSYNTQPDDCTSTPQRPVDHVTSERPKPDHKPRDDRDQTYVTSKSQHSSPCVVPDNVPNGQQTPETQPGTENRAPKLPSGHPHGNREDFQKDNKTGTESGF